jgi:hypothetical protein
LLYNGGYDECDYTKTALHPEDHSEYGWFAEDELIQATTPGKGLEDDEFIAMKKGFALLRGETLVF